MPFTASNPEELRALVIALAAASAREPELRARVARWFRAGLELVEDDRAADTEETQAFALREAAEHLGMAAEHVSWLAKMAGRIRRAH